MAPGTLFSSPIRPPRPTRCHPERSEGSATLPSATTTLIHALVPLTILEAIQRLDAPTEDGLEEFHRELAIKRLGMSDTVATQIERFRRLAGRGPGVEMEEAAALFRLAGRRSDAGLVFADAGRRAGRHAIGGGG